MIQVIKKATFRIEVKDLNTKEVRVISLSDHKNLNVDKIKDIVISCIEKVATGEHKD